MKATDEQIVTFISDYIERHGYSPSFRDIGKAADIRSPSTVKYRLENLRAKKLIKYDDGIARSIRVVK